MKCSGAFVKRERIISTIRTTVEPPLNGGGTDEHLPSRFILCAKIAMNKLLDFGRKAMFYVRVLSGYEERKIRSYRLQLQNRIQRAEAKKAALNNVPEQIILSEVRQMVEHMQSVNKKIEETETAIQEYLKSIDKDAEMIVKMQLDGEEKTMKRMAETMRNQALLEKVEADHIAGLQNAESIKQTQISESTPAQKAQI